MQLRTNDFPGPSSSAEPESLSDLRSPSDGVQSRRTFFQKLGLGAGAAALAALTVKGCSYDVPESGARLNHGVPSDFKMVQQFLAHGTTMNFWTGNLWSGYMYYGQADERKMHLTDTFMYFDSAGEKVATAQARLFSWGNQIDISDAAGKLIGTVKEEKLGNMLSWKKYYRIEDAHGRLVAHSAKLDFLATNVEMKNPAGEEVASMSRRWINPITDKWTVHIDDSIDARLIIFVPAFKTNSDDNKAQK